MVVALTAAVLLAGCTWGSYISINSRGNSSVGVSTGHMSKQFSTFTGDMNHNIKVKSNQKINVRYDVDLTKGSLSIRITSPGGLPIWEKSFTGSEQEDLTIDTDGPGNYRFTLVGDDAGGRYDVSWETR
jgi:hypothetical protein